MTEKKYTKGPLPMVNHSNISKHIENYVVINGKNNGISNKSMTLLVDEVNNKEIIITNVSPLIEKGKYVKIVGKVNRDLSIEYIDHYILQNDFDLQLVNDTVGLMQHPVLAGLFNSDVNAEN